MGSRKKKAAPPQPQPAGIAELRECFLRTTAPVDTEFVFSDVGKLQLTVRRANPTPPPPIPAKPVPKETDRRLWMLESDDEVNGLVADAIVFGYEVGRRHERGLGTFADVPGQGLDQRPLILDPGDPPDEDR